VWVRGEVRQGSVSYFLTIGETMPSLDLVKLLVLVEHPAHVELGGLARGEVAEAELHVNGAVTIGGGASLVGAGDLVELDGPRVVIVEATVAGTGAGITREEAKESEPTEEVAETKEYLSPLFFWPRMVLWVM